MCRHVARRALRFGSTTGTRIYTTQIHKRLCCCYYLCIEAELPPTNNKKRWLCILSFSHRYSSWLTAHRWARHPIHASLHVFFLLFFIQHGSMSWKKKKKRTLIFVGEEFVARKTIPRQREGEEGKGFVTVCTCSLFRKDDRIFPFCYLSA